MQVMSHPGVDYTRTVSNHIIDIIDVLGIEAARAALLKVLPYSNLPFGAHSQELRLSDMHLCIWPVQAVVGMSDHFSWLKTGLHWQPRSGLMVSSMS